MVDSQNRSRFRSNTLRNSRACFAAIAVVAAAGATACSSSGQGGGAAGAGGGLQAKGGSAAAGTSSSLGGASTGAGGTTASGGSSGGNPSFGGTSASSGGTGANQGGTTASGGTSSGGNRASGGTSASSGGTGTSQGGTAGTAGSSAGGVRSSGGASAASGGSAGAGAGAVRWIGRVDASNPAAVKFAWSATGFAATVAGTKISVQLQTEGATTAAFFQPVIDGKTAARFQVPMGSARTVVLAENLAAGNHTVELYRENEGNYGDSVFLGFVDGTVVGAPPAPTRFIEIIGDSISAGYGNLGSETHPPWQSMCGFTLDTESAYAAYGPALGRLLNAEVSVIARSGWGMYRDLSGSKTNVLSSIYENTLGDQAAPRFNFTRQPDAVIINLGTNDSNPDDPGQAYEDAYVAFLRKVRTHYANAWIFLTIGPMTSDPLLAAMRTHIDHVVTKIADAKIVQVPLEPQDSTSTGCDFHPNVAEHQKLATALKAAIQPKLNW
jgi:lysophospholipase L1-like esterase